MQKKPWDQIGSWFQKLLIVSDLRIQGNVTNWIRELQKNLQLTCQAIVKGKALPAGAGWGTSVSHPTSIPPCLEVPASHFVPASSKQKTLQNLQTPPRPGLSKGGTVLAFKRGIWGFWPYGERAQKAQGCRVILRQIGPRVSCGGQACSAWEIRKQWLKTDSWRDCQAALIHSPARRLGPSAGRSLPASPGVHSTGGRGRGWRHVKGLGLDRFQPSPPPAPG